MKMGSSGVFGPKIDTPKAVLRYEIKLLEALETQQTRPSTTEEGIIICDGDG